VATEEGLVHIRTVAADAWAATLGAALGPAHVGAARGPTHVGAARGPAHVNIQFEKPLEPTFVSDDVPSGLVVHRDPPGDLKSGPSAASKDRAAAGIDASESLRRELGGFRRPLIVCGPAHDPQWGRAALELARSIGAPVVGDPLSGARFGPGSGEYTVGGADLFLSSERVAEALSPDVIVRVGPAVTSASVQRFLGRQVDGKPLHLVVDLASRLSDHLGVMTKTVIGDPIATLRGASGAVQAEDGWLERWRTVDRAVREALAPALETEWFEGAVAAAIASTLPEGATWFVGNSMPIRDVDAFARCSPRSVHAVGFRGASGIDGNVSGAIGAAVGRGKPAVALLGDLTLLHDVGALLLGRSIEVSLQIVVIQNRGGGIFHMLPIREHDPPFTPYIVMPHSVDFAAVAQAARIPHRSVTSLDELRDGLVRGFDVPGIQMLEAAVDREENWERRNVVAEHARAAAEAAL